VSVFGAKFPDELPRDAAGVLRYTHNAPGVLSMANSGPNTNGSQFFVTLCPLTSLDGKHTVFGRLVAGWKTWARQVRPRRNQQSPS
jgi:cyclophilin family peptidyl-prolyl cis-trans isomerase